ncbi:hypothetical protein CONPUDRAFT_167377 [Coniophora puteana RWD-64-598 SS2]|uniref:RRM domain-containing protein n=1 Tax=Coniophora puteana (strain RWD-64-598) TaxID=741705 RepID=A0A5M3MGW9_CONPW|nr:uncharacterized protein CONPUDRAFT_167377 [Coniophora puteana RWD-64-598 SS2]EIW78353.1 hypothetical protein CONPUDRAFT_167377 [Coniophora puteana RWD-64-598 SS2]
MNSHPRGPPVRFNSYYSPKKQLLGNHAGQVAPAWRGVPPKAPDLANGTSSLGSKILLSRLPTDVGELEVEELFKKTVGPLREVFMIYNSQGRSKGMAVVAFQRAADAQVARQRYDGKYIDGRRPIKIEIIVDSTSTSIAPATPAAPSAPTLLNRIGGINKPANPSIASRIGAPVGVVPAVNGTLQTKARAVPQVRVGSAASGPRRLRTKKGPKRVKKSVEQLDQDMDEYVAGRSDS